MAETSKNTINVSKTLSECQQMRSATVFYKGMFSASPYVLPKEVLRKTELNNSSFNTNLKDFVGPNDYVCSSITVKNQLYQNGDLIVIGIEDVYNLYVGLVKTIVVKSNDVYFLVQRYHAERDILHYYTCEKSIQDYYEFINYKNVVDFRPLVYRGSVEKFVFVLNHYISYDYQ